LFGNLLVDFKNGKHENADELIKLGADPKAVFGYIAAKNSPEYKRIVKAAGERAQTGHGAPGSGSRYTGD
jgi:hypothetical protein